MTDLVARVFAILLGLAVIAGGVVIIPNRRGMHEYFGAEWGRRFGATGRVLANRSRPNHLLYPAVGLILMGGLIVVLSVISPHIGGPHV